LPPTPPATLLPYTTLFRSAHLGGDGGVALRPARGQRGETHADGEDDGGQRRSQRPLGKLSGEQRTRDDAGDRAGEHREGQRRIRSEEHTSELQSRFDLVCR